METRFKTKLSEVLLPGRGENRTRSARISVRDVGVGRTAADGINELFDVRVNKTSNQLFERHRQPARLSGRSDRNHPPKEPHKGV